MRITSLAALGVLACGAAFSASRSETITYVDGNIAGISPHSGGTLLLSDEAALTFRTGSKTVKVPYSSVTKAELGGTLSHSHDVPMYKVWTLPKRVLPKKTHTQYLTVNFKNEAGEARSMTLELAEASASSALATINRHKASMEASAPASPAADSTPVASAPETAKAAETPQVAATPKRATRSKAAPTPQAASTAAKTSDTDWWNNQVWKTTRNGDKWPQSGTVAAGGQE